MKIFISFIVCMFFSIMPLVSIAYANSTIAPDGAWCWFSEDRAIEVNGKTYVGYLTREAQVGISQIDYDGKTVNSAIIANTYVTVDNCGDDHNHPSLLALPDGRIIAFYQNHSMERRIYYKYTTKPGDISSWSGEYFINTSGLTSYANAFYLSSENRIYLFSRINNVATMICSDDLGLSWSVEKPIIFRPGARPYVKYSSNGVDEIYVAFTNGHPGEVANTSLHYMKYKAGAFYGAADNLIKTVQNLPVDVIEADAVYTPDGVSGKSWVWDVKFKTDGTPAILYTRYPNDQTHEYWYAGFENGAWNSKFLINSGGWIPTADFTIGVPQPNYSGGLVFDSRSTNTIYLSTTVGNTFEIQKWVSNGDNYIKTNVTQNSTDTNVRPYSVRGSSDDKINLLWMKGSYVYYTNYTTGIETDYDLSQFTFKEPIHSSDSRLYENPYVFYYDFENVNQKVTKDLVRGLDTAVKLGATIENGKLKSLGYNSAPTEVAAAVSTITGLKQMSFSAKVYIDQLPASGSYGVLGAREGANYIKFLINQDGSVQFGLKLFEGYKTVKTDKNLIDKQKWVNLFAVYSQNELAIYVDGIKKASLPLIGSTEIYSRSDSAFVIGGDLASVPMLGLVDDVALYSKALTSVEISKIMNGERAYEIASSSIALPKATTTTAPLLSRKLPNAQFSDLSQEFPIYGVTTNVSSDPAYPIGNIRDNKLDTYYTAAPLSEPIIEVDLGEAKSIQAIAMAFYQGALRSYPFEVETSLDKENWDLFYVGKSGKTTNGFEGYASTPKTARYVRLYGHGSDVSQWTGIYEIKVFGNVIANSNTFYQNSFNGENIALTSTATALTQTINGLTYGKSLKEFSLVTKAVEGRGNVIELSEPTAKAGNAYIEYVLPQAATDYLIIEADIKETVSSAWGGFQAFDSSISTTNQAVLFATNSPQFINQYDGVNNVNVAPFEVGTWYRIKLVLDIKARTYNAYINGKLVGESLGFKIANTNQITSVRIATGGGAGGTILVDNLIIASNPRYIRNTTAIDNIYTYQIAPSNYTDLVAGSYASNVFINSNVATIVKALYTGRKLADVKVSNINLQEGKKIMNVEEFTTNSSYSTKIISLGSFITLKPNN